MHPMYEQSGPFTDAATAAAELHVSGQQLADLISIGSVLACRTEEGSWLFPTWQFTAGSVLPALLPVLEAWAGADGWVVAVWLNKPHAALQGRTPRAALFEYEPAAVARVAMNDRAAVTN